MSRLMSVSHTEAQVRARTKTVTRRDGWRTVKVGDTLTLCPKVMGRRHRCDGCDGLGILRGTAFLGRRECPTCAGSGYVTEPLDRIVDVTVIAAFREPLDLITPSEVVAEGFPDWTPEQFIDFYTATFKVPRDHVVTRIEWRYPEAD